MTDIGTSARIGAGRPAWIDWRVAVLACGMFAIGTDSFVIAGILPRIAPDLHVETAMAGQLITAYALSYAVATPVAAALTANMPRDRVLLAGLLIFAIGNLATAFAPEIYSALATRAVSGVGAAIFAPAASAAAMALSDPSRRGRALGTMMVGLSAATAFGAPLGTALSEFIGWRAIIVLVASLGALVALGVAAFIGRIAAPHATPTLRRMARFTERRTTGALLATFLVLAGLYTVYSYVSAVFQPVTRGDGTALAMLLWVWGLGAVAGAILGGRLTDTYGSRAVVNLTLICLAIDIAALHWTRAFAAAAAVSVLIWGLCGFGFTVSQQHRLTADSPHSAQVILGLYATAVYLGAAASGVIGALVLQLCGAGALPLVGAALVAAGLLVSEMTGYLPSEKPARS